MVWFDRIKKIGIEDLILRDKSGQEDAVSINTAKKRLSQYCYNTKGMTEMAGYYFLSVLDESERLYNKDNADIDYYSLSDVLRYKFEHIVRSKVKDLKGSSKLDVELAVVEEYAKEMSIVAGGRTHTALDVFGYDIAQEIFDCMSDKAKEAMSVETYQYFHKSGVETREMGQSYINYLEARHNKKEVKGMEV